MGVGPAVDVSPVGALFLVLGLTAWLHSRRAFILVLSSAVPFSTTAGVSIGQSSIPPFFLLAVPATAAAFFGVVRLGVPQRALRILLAFTAWSIIATVVGPTLFAGLPVLEPRGGIDSAVGWPTPLSYTVPMAAQIVYLILGTGVTLFLAQQDRLHPGLLTPGVAIGTVLSATSMLPSVRPWVDTFFRDYASAQFNPFEVRHVGVFAEPSYLAVFAFASMLYSAHRAAVVNGWRRVLLLLLAACAMWNGYLTESGTFVASCVVATVALSLWAAARLPARGLQPSVALTALALTGLAVIDHRRLGDFIDVITEKIATDSFTNRTTSNLFSLGITVDTWGLGVGLGANRPSSFALLLLSNVGIIGFGLYAGMIIYAVSQARRREQWRPVVTALVALLAAKVLAEPALSTPAMWFVLGACIYASTASSEALAQPLEAEVDSQGDDLAPSPGRSPDSSLRTTIPAVVQETLPRADRERREAAAIASRHSSRSVGSRT